MPSHRYLVRAKTRLFDDWVIISDCRTRQLAITSADTQRAYGNMAQVIDTTTGVVIYNAGAGSC